MDAATHTPPFRNEGVNPKCWGLAASWSCQSQPQLKRATSLKVDSPHPIFDSYGGPQLWATLKSHPRFRSLQRADWGLCGGSMTAGPSFHPARFHRQALTLTASQQAPCRLISISEAASPQPTPREPRLRVLCDLSASVCVYLHSMTRSDPLVRRVLVLS